MTAPELPFMPLEAQLEALREGYCNAINDVMDACLATLALPAHQKALCEDAAQFLVYLLAVKVVTNNGDPLNTKHLLQAYRHLNKKIEKEVPGMLFNFAREVEAQGRRVGEPVQ